MKLTLLTTVAGLSVSGIASAAALTNGNLAVYRVGDGTTALSTAAQAVFIDEYTPTGTLVQSIPMPTVASGSSLSLVAGGSANSEGFLTLSGDNSSLALSGYNTAVGAASPGGGAANTPARTIGLLNVATGVVDTTTGVSDVSGNARGAYADGTTVFYSASSGGYRSTTAGTNGTTTQLVTTPTNNRVIRAFAGQLYGSTGSGTTRIGTIGTGVSGAAGQTFASLPGISSTNVVSGYGFYLADLTSTVAGVDTLYVADDAATTGGLQKYSLVAGTWTSNGKIGVGADGYRGLDAVVTPAGVQLYATIGANQIVGLLDASGYNATLTGTPTSIATAGTNTAFRGIAALVPEPTALAFTGLAGVLIGRRRRV